MPHNDDITLLRRHWPVDQPSDDLADRILAHALTLPQQQPVFAGLRSRFAQFMATIATPAPMKGLAFAACIMIAVIALDPQPNGTTSSKSAVKSPQALEHIVEQFIWDDYRY